MLRLQRVVPVVLALATITVAPACASRVGYYHNPSSRIIYDGGYRYGLDDGRGRGEDDARRGRAYNYERHRQFRNADDGYRGYGNRNAYREDYRRGFVAGYDEGYRRYTRNDRTYRGSGPYVYGGRQQAPAHVSPAGRNGYRDGYEEGRDDARDGDRYDPVRASRYRSGDHDYDRRYGARDVYKRDYRAAFQQGYDQGYREGRGR